MDASWEDEINRQEWVEREEEDRGARVGREREREEIGTLTERRKRRRQGWTDSGSPVEEDERCLRYQAVRWPLFRMFRRLAVTQEQHKSSGC